MPGPDYDQDVLFGEIEDGSTVYEFTIPRYGHDITPGKSVKWIKRVKRSNVPGWLNRKFASPNPLRQLERSEHNYVFDTMYERYFVDGQFVCKFRIEAQEFSALDDFLFKQIVLYAAALHENIHESNIRDISNQSISEVVAKLDFSEDIPDQRIMISSPGYIVIYSKNLIPIVAAVLMTMAASQSPLQAGDLAQPQVSIVNSADDSQVATECSADVQSEVLEDLNAMGYERWRELCTIEHQARRRTQLSPGMVVQPEIQGASGQTR